MIQPETMATARPMGRKPIGKPIPVRLPPEMLARIKALVGTYGVAGLIREAVERELERRENGQK